MPPALGQCPGVPGGAGEGIPGRVGKGSPARSLAPASTQVLISTTLEKPARAQSDVRREPEGNRAPGWAALTLPTTDVLYNWEIMSCLHHKRKARELSETPAPGQAASCTHRLSHWPKVQPLLSQGWNPAARGVTGTQLPAAGCRAGQAALAALLPSADRGSCSCCNTSSGFTNQFGGRQ